MRKNIIIITIVLVFLLIFSIPSNAIKLGAIFSGCDLQEVVSAEFEKVDTISLTTSIYK